MRRPIRRILVAVKDPTARRLPAVIKGAQLARACHAQLELFHGISAPLYVDALSEPLPRVERRMRDRIVKQLEAMAAKLRPQGLQVSVSATWDFPVYEAIVRHASRCGADLIVAEQHAKHHFAPGLLRLTDWELLRNSIVPVLLVKTRAPYRRPAVLAAVDPRHELGKPASLDAEIMRLAKYIASRLHGPLHAIHAYDALPQHQPARQLLSEESVRKLTAQIRRAAGRRFNQSIAAWNIPRVRRHLIGRHPIDAIEQIARKTHSSIVVIGTLSRTGIKGFFFGNTAEALLDSLNCDMLIVKPEGFAARVPRRVRGPRLAAPPVIPGY